MKFLGLIVSSLIMTACTIVSIPITIVGSEGTMRGTAKAGMKNMTFHVSNSKTECSGSFDTKSKARTVSMAVECNDDRKGYATMSFDPVTHTGEGNIRLSDGYEAKILFGNAAVSVKK